MTWQLQGLRPDAQFDEVLGETASRKSLQKATYKHHRPLPATGPTVQQQACTKDPVASYRQATAACDIPDRT